MDAATLKEIRHRLEGAKILATQELPCVHCLTIEHYANDVAALLGLLDAACSPVRTWTCAPAKVVTREPVFNEDGQHIYDRVKRTVNVNPADLTWKWGESREPVCTCGVAEGAIHDPTCAAIINFKCVCGEPTDEGVFHRLDGPCVVIVRPSVGEVKRAIMACACKTLLNGHEAGCPLRTP